MKLTLNVRNRKPLVDLVSRFAGEAAVYMRMPTYAYRIGGYMVTREGNLEAPDDLDFAVIHALYEALEGGGYHPKEAEPVAETADIEETAEPDIEAEENVRADETAEQEKLPARLQPILLTLRKLPACLRMFWGSSIPCVPL